MSRNYKIQLFFHSEQIEQALLATARIADHRRQKSTVVVLPGDRLITLPFTSGFNTETAVLSVGDSATGTGQAHSEFYSGSRARPGDNPLRFETTLLFAPDDAIQWYLKRHSEFLKDVSLEISGTEYASIGYIYLAVALGNRYGRLSFTAAGSDMSDMFVESESIQNRFLELLQTAGGLGGIIDIELEKYYVLGDPYRSIVIDIDPAYLNTGYHVYLDHFVDVALRAIRAGDPN
jgi:hypothetical protein